MNKILSAVGGLKDGCLRYLKQMKIQNTWDGLATRPGCTPPLA